VVYYLKNEQVNKFKIPLTLGIVGIFAKENFARCLIQRNVRLTLRVFNLYPTIMADGLEAFNSALFLDSSRTTSTSKRREAAVNAEICLLYIYICDIGSHMSVS